MADDKKTSLNSGSPQAGDAAKTEEQQAAEFGIQRIFVKDLSFESPASPKIFLEQWQPQLNMDLKTKTNAMADGAHEVILTVTVTVKMKEEVAFIIEVQQAGIFTIKNLPEDQLRPMLGSFCPNILYPYAREAISNIAMRGGFPQLYLAPVNFDALYQQQVKAQKEAEDKGGATDTGLQEANGSLQ